MDEHRHHEDLIQAITKEYRNILENSGQGIYIYLDDSHKVCNKKFASLLGYGTPAEWSRIQDNFLETIVASKSQETLANTYQKAMGQFVGSTIKVTWKKKSGSTVETTVVLVPISHAGHLFALHFVS
jgi:PAS domain S-box-containing protein